MAGIAENERECEQRPSQIVLVLEFGSAVCYLLNLSVPKAPFEKPPGLHACRAPSSARPWLLHLSDEANAGSRNAGGCYVLEPRPTNAVENEDDWRWVLIYGLATPP